MTAELVARPRAVWVDVPSAHEWESYRQQCVVIAESGLMPAGLNGRPKAVMTVMLKGRELGISPMTALEEVFIIEGRTSMSAKLQQALVRGAGHDVWVEEADDDHAVVCGKRRGSERVAKVVFNKSSVSPDKFVSRSGKPTNWQTVPEDMCVARAYSRLFRREFADVLVGVAGTPDELGAVEYADGTIEVPRATRVAATRGPAAAAEPAPDAAPAAAPEPAAPADPAAVEAEIRADLDAFTAGQDWHDYVGAHVRRRTRQQMAADRLAAHEAAGHPLLAREDPLATGDSGIPAHYDAEPVAETPAAVTPEADPEPAGDAAPETFVDDDVCLTGPHTDEGLPLHEGECRYDDDALAGADPLAVGDVIDGTLAELGGDPLGDGVAVTADPLAVSGDDVLDGAGDMAKSGRLPDTGIPDTVATPDGSPAADAVSDRTVEDVLADIDSAAMVLGKTRSQLMLRWIAAQRKNPEDATVAELEAFLASVLPYVEAEQRKGAGS